MKTLQEIKDEIAREFNSYFDWRSFENGVQAGNIKFFHYKKAIDEVAKRYAEEALKEAADTKRLNPVIYQTVEDNLFLGSDEIAKSISANILNIINELK